MTASARNIVGTGATLLTLFAAPAVASAQQTLEPVRVTASVSRADQLEAEAATLTQAMKTFKKAARLYETAADVRGERDPRMANCLRNAAYLRYYTGDRDASATLMERAADQSAAMGDVVAAANSYVDAAIVALELKQTDRALTLGRRGERLMNSPLLDESQRLALRSRVTDEQRVAFATRP